MNIDDLTIGQARELSSLFGAGSSQNTSTGLNQMVGKKVIVRTYSAGVWFGILAEKSGSEVILRNARRMWKWHTKESISLSSISIHGVDNSRSRIAAAVEEQWLNAVEITPCEPLAIKSLESADVSAAS